MRRTVFFSIASDSLLSLITSLRDCSSRKSMRRSSRVLRVDLLTRRSVNNTKMPYRCRPYVYNTPSVRPLSVGLSVCTVSARVDLLTRRSVNNTKMPYRCRPYVYNTPSVRPLSVGLSVCTVSVVFLIHFRKRNETQ